MSRSEPIPRIVTEEALAGFTAEQVLDVTTAITMVLSLPQAAGTHVDALAIASGQGEDWRFTHAIRTWEANAGLRLLLVANGNPAEQTHADITPAYLRERGLRRLNGVHIQAEPAPNTALQAAWIVNQVQEHSVTSLALAVSPYHLPRAYLTVLKELIKVGIRIPLIPLPVAVAPDTPVPETRATAYDLVPGEVRRILTYMEYGWTATPDELQKYLHWLWTDHEPLLVGSFV